MSAREQAERIVGRVDRGPMISDISGSYKEHREAVVATLAAAIEETWVENEVEAVKQEQPDPGAKTVRIGQRRIKAMVARREALSALGVTVDPEETT